MMHHAAEEPSDPFEFPEPTRLSLSEQMDRWEGRYVELRTAEVPLGWSNHPAHLRLETYFAGPRNINDGLHPSVHFSHPRPILTDTEATYIFEEEGRGYFIWNDISGYVAEIREKSWDDIIEKMNEGGVTSITLSLLRSLDGPSGEPTSNIPYPPNPDFVDRPLMKKIQLPPPRSTLFVGPDGCGKTELAIQYASKVRADSPQTWVFWLCATTKEQFDQDLLAIADILPGRPLRNDDDSQMDVVLDWLCKPGGERWLMVVDDVNSTAVELWPTIDTLWKSNQSGAFILTSRDSLQNLPMKPYFTGSLSLGVPKLDKDEALQLLQKKLKQPNKADARNLINRITWTPLAVDLAAAALNKGLISVSGFIAITMKVGQENPFVVALYSLIAHLSSFEKNLLYFVSSFRPPEIPSLWIRSSLEWRDDDEEFDKLAATRRSLTKLSLLTNVSITHAYKMHAEVQTFMAAWLRVTDPQNQVFKNIKLYVESRRSMEDHELRSLIPETIPGNSFKMLRTYAKQIEAIEKEYGYIEKQSKPR